MCGANYSIFFGVSHASWCNTEFQGLFWTLRSTALRGSLKNYREACWYGILQYWVELFDKSFLERSSDVWRCEDQKRCLHQRVSKPTARKQRDKVKSSPWVLSKICDIQKTQFQVGCKIVRNVPIVFELGFLSWIYFIRAWLHNDLIATKLIYSPKNND